MNDYTFDSFDDDIDEPLTPAQQEECRRLAQKYKEFVKAVHNDVGYWAEQLIRGAIPYNNHHAWGVADDDL